MEVRRRWRWAVQEQRIEMIFEIRRQEHPQKREERTNEGLVRTQISLTWVISSSAHGARNSLTARVQTLREAGAHPSGSPGK